MICSAEAERVKLERKVLGRVTWSFSQSKSVKQVEKLDFTIFELGANSLITSVAIGIGVAVSISVTVGVIVAVSIIVVVAVCWLLIVGLCWGD